MNKYTVLIAVVALLVVGAGQALAQAQKTAFVNSEVILRELPEAQRARTEIEGVVKGWNDELERMTNEFQQGIEEFQQKQALYQPTKRQEEERRLANLRQQLQDYQVRKFDSRNGEIVELQESKLGPIREKVLSAIEAVAKEDGFTFVFDKASEVLLLYADSQFDLTYRVIDRLKRGGSTKK